MDVDPVNPWTTPTPAYPCSPRTPTPRSPTHEEGHRQKIRAVAGPGRRENDNLRDWESFHKEKTQEARAKAKQLAHENNQLRLALEDATAKLGTPAGVDPDKQQLLETLIEQASVVRNLQSDIHDKTSAIQSLQRDQDELRAMLTVAQKDQMTQFTAQLAATQKLLTERDAEVAKLSNNLIERHDEAMQLRTNLTQAQKTPMQRVVQRRGTRASLAPVLNTSTPLINIPLNPIPVPMATAGSGSTPNAAGTSRRKSILSATPGLAEMLGTDVASLAPLIESFEKLVTNAANVSVTADSPAATRKRGTGSKGKRRQRKSTSMGQSAFKNYIHAVVRNVIHESFGVLRTLDFQTHVPATEADVKACEEYEREPAANRFQWDFGVRYLESRWNSLMVTKIVDLTYKRDQEDLNLIVDSDLERDMLEAIVLEKLESYRRAFKQIQPRFDEDQGRMETVKEARDRAADTIEQTHLDARSNSSKHRKFNTRVETIKMTIELKKHASALDLAAWERLLELVNHLGEHGMSSEEEDETEVGNARIIIYKVKLCAWRQPSIVGYLKFVDAQTAGYRKTQLGPKAAPRFRVDEHGVSAPPSGLPHSLYNEDWLQTQSPSVLKKLQVSKEVFELFVAATERMVFN
ncbi:hypothetical protein GGX14DRAFT_408625 [Mycena pura]|uniref:Uncharacterized protein n=1 Tax=Mycena pura TaxID=153505 RepID=A0AAD6UKR2_9AGAR|nr:hypothetical protein GGX14DRAFT_408625 [Mycena pura]